MPQRYFHQIKILIYIYITRKHTLFNEEIDIIFIFCTFCTRKVTQNYAKREFDIYTHFFFNVI